MSNQNNLQGITILPEHIRANLAQYSEHENLTCLQCGYIGIMGLRRTESKDKSAPNDKRALKIILYVVMVAAVAIAGFGKLLYNYNMSLWVFLILGSFWGLLGVDIKSKYFECPNCNVELLKK